MPVLHPGWTTLTLSSPINESDLVQLLDPIPHPTAGKWLVSAFSTSLSKDEKVGSGLAKLLDGRAIGIPVKTINLGALLTADAASTQSMMLLEEEWQAVRDFARTMFSSGEMPPFLSDSSWSAARERQEGVAGLALVEDGSWAFEASGALS